MLILISCGGSSVAADATDFTHLQNLTLEAFPHLAALKEEWAFAAQVESLNLTVFNESTYRAISQLVAADAGLVTLTVTRHQKQPPITSTAVETVLAEIIYANGAVSDPFPVKVHRTYRAMLQEAIGADLVQQAFGRNANSIALAFTVLNEPNHDVDVDGDADLVLFMEALKHFGPQAVRLRIEANVASSTKLLAAMPSKAATSTPRSASASRGSHVDLD
jgi:hypothetical protein